jgi:ABC-type glycerol-3-phosphate transport system substrate-binding protein
MFKKRLWIGVSILVVLLLASTVLGVTKVQLWNDKSGAPSWEPLFSELSTIAASEIGIGFEPVGYSTSEYQSILRAALPTSAAPGLFTWWSGYYMKSLVDSGLVLDLTPIWNKYASDYSAGLRSAYEFNGKIYGVPLYLDYWVVWYDVPLFKKYGLTPPKTWEEFIALCNTLKADGITPLGQTIADGWESFIWFEQILIGLDPNAYSELMAGKINYDAPVVKQTFDIWKSMINARYFTSPDITLGQMATLLGEGKLGMVLMGMWYTATLNAAGLKPGTDYSCFILPPVEPNTPKAIIFETAPLMISKNAKDAQEAYKIAEWWMSPQGDEAWSKIMTFAPANEKSSTSFLPEPIKKINEEVTNDNYIQLQRFWEDTPTPICLDAVGELGRFILHPDQENSIIADLCKIADNYWNSHE